MTSKGKKGDSKTVHLLAGATSGLVSCVLLQPLDLIKTRVQQNLHTKPSPGTSLSSHVSSIPKPPSSILSLARDIIRTESPLSLWKGTVPTIMRNVPGAGLYFFALNEIRNTMKRTPLFARSTDFINLSSGIFARSNVFQYSGLYAAMKDIVKKEGMRGLFAGSVATALRDAPFAGIYVFFYENFKILLSNTSSQSMLVNLGSGLLGGFSATLLTQPFDVLKTRMQVYPNEYKSMTQSLVKILKQEGMKGFLSGAMPRVLRKSFSSAISWTIYEELVRLYASRNESIASTRI